MNELEEESWEALASRFERRDGESLLPIYSDHSTSSSLAPKEEQLDPVAFFTDLLRRNNGIFPMSKTSRLLKQQPRLKAKVGKIRRFINQTHPELFLLEKIDGRWEIKLKSITGPSYGAGNQISLLLHDQTLEENHDDQMEDIRYCFHHIDMIPRMQQLSHRLNLALQALKEDNYQSTSAVSCCYSKNSTSVS